ncbi:TetR/AcrR family transcriptional regulator [Streptosporangium minutum]|uniref:HTH tetR-type domain-containing protein n=1 Tax=Streptosporangium minutum TaxID=569862 RepID=A0A243RI46_9ACTN|nr:TetR/AcrR family transcriptional regulator [Streptosporangium minutum]OUC94456.1 hypothetical protein CA984_22365 [Streptosporangium minutum]
MLSHAKRLQITKAAMGVRLSAGGTTPSIDEIAAAADVSRRTVYMYFPSLDHLLIDATAGAINEPPVKEAWMSSNSETAACPAGMGGGRCMTLDPETSAKVTRYRRR